MNAALIPFAFEENLVRVHLDENGEPWFVAKDIAKALEYAEASNPARLVAHVPEEWKGVKRIHTLGGNQEMLCLSEQGLYFFLNRSDKPKALPLQKWLAGDVLPSIRKTGTYAMPGAKRAMPERSSAEYLNADDIGLSLSARALGQRVKADLMETARQVAKDQGMTGDHLYIYANLCNLVAENSGVVRALPGRRFAHGKEETLREFAGECLELVPDAAPLCDEEIHAAHVRWCTRYKREPLARATLVEGLALLLPGVSVTRPGQRHGKGHSRPRPAYLRGLALSAHWRWSL